MTRNLPLRCPSCLSDLQVRSLECTECNTQVTGNFDLPLLARLSSDDQLFIIDFVKTSGSLKEMSKYLKLSYPTVRNMLDDLIERINNIESNTDCNEFNNTKIL